MQLGLFDSPAATVSLEDAILYALGEFQSRGHELADRELALDRLIGAFSRACSKFGFGEFSDQDIIECLRLLGVRVKELPSFVAKHPYRVTIGQEIASAALLSFEARHSERTVSVNKVD